MNCAFCFYAEPFEKKPAEFVIEGISACENHVNDITGSGFGRDLMMVQNRG